MPDSLTNGLRAKDISDWIKIGVLIATMAAGYESLRSQVAEHTGKINDIQSSVGQMRKEQKTNNTIINNKIGKLNMYLCSKDSTRGCSLLNDDEPIPEQ